MTLAAENHSDVWTVSSASGKMPSLINCDAVLNIAGQCRQLLFCGFISLALVIPVYSDVFLNKWAVHLDGGPRAADDLAEKHGFTNLGQVGCSSTQRLF